MRVLLRATCRRVVVDMFALRTTLLELETTFNGQQPNDRSFGTNHPHAASHTPAHSAGEWVQKETASLQQSLKASQPEKVTRQNPVESKWELCRIKHVHV